MKKRNKYILSSLGLLLIIALFIFFLNKQPKKEIKSKEHKKETTIENTLENIKVDSDKEELYNELNNLFIGLGKDASLDDLENLASGKISIDEFVPNQYKDSLYFYDTYSSDDDKSLAYQAIVSISYIIREDKNFKLDNKEKEILINRIALDKKRGIASVPLSLYSDNLSTSYIDMIYDNGKWKPIMRNLVNEIKLLDYIGTKYIDKEE